jgi:anti-sigma B factor antagonist
MPKTFASPGSTVHRGAPAFPRFDCTLRAGGLDAAWVRVTGQLDIATGPQLTEMLGSAEESAQRVVLDLRQLTFIDSAGLHVILNASARAKAAGRRLVLVRGPSPVDLVFREADASASLEIVDLDPVEPPVQALLKLAQRRGAA